MNSKPPGAGKSSFDLIDSKRLFSGMGLKKGDIFLDLGCGIGSYSIAASEYVGNNGRVYAVDLWKPGIDILKQTLIAERIKTVMPIVADMGKNLPLDEDSVDLCLMATVFHDLLQAGVHEQALVETRRVLKKDAQLAIVEFKKREEPPGPPMHIRISTQDLEKTLDRYGFHQIATREIGPYHYVSLFACGNEKTDH
jgi:ubiquinone/menaquinone biosynthesis C-methylase UbiE